MMDSTTMSSSSGVRWVSAVAGVVAAAVAVGATELAAGLLPGGASLYAAIGNRVVALTPGSVAQWAIDVLGGANRLVLLLTMGAVMAAAGALVGIAAASRRWAGAAGIGVFAALGAAGGLSDPVVPALTALLAPAAGWATGTVALEVLGRRVPTRPGRARPERARTASPASGHDTAPGKQISRRAFLTAAAAGVGLAAAGALGGLRLQARDAVRQARAALHLPDPADALPPPPRAAAIGDVEGLSPLVTPNEDFYRIDAAVGVPRVDPDGHVVRVTGMVDEPFAVSYRELLDMPHVEADVTLSCVSNLVGGDLVGNARWQGVPLPDLLDRAGVRPDATQVVGRSVDDWTGGFPVEAVYDGRDALVAVGMNGEPLPARHGFPVRLVIAGLYGYVSDTKWLSEIELTTFEAYDAYWIQRGWAQHGPIKTQSRIDVPSTGAELRAGTVPVAGVAWAGVRGVSAVEVSIDGGEWREADLAEELSASSWRQWVYRWEAQPGEHEVAVRATDGDGDTQTSVRTDALPDGATGHHTIQVAVG